MWMRTLNEHQNIQYMCNVCNTVYMLWHYQGIECNLWRDKNIQLILFRNFAILHIILIWSQNLNPNLTFVTIEFVWLECYNSPIPSSKKVHQLNIDRMSAVLIVFGSCCVMWCAFTGTGPTCVYTVQLYERFGYTGPRHRPVIDHHK